MEMADGTLDSEVGARISNGLSIMRACLETQKLEQLEARMDEMPTGLPMRGQALRARGPAPMKPSAFRIERLLANVEAEVERRGLRARRYVFHPDEVAEAEAQGLPYVLVPRVLSRREWIERYGEQPAADPGDQ